MSNGPNGEMHAAELIDRSVLTEEAVIGKTKNIEISSRTKFGEAGGAVRAEHTKSEDRSEIARKSANARWG